MHRKARLDYCFVAAIRTFRGVAVAEGGCPNPAVQKKSVKSACPVKFRRTI